MEARNSRFSIFDFRFLLTAVAIIARVYLGGVFIWAAWGKIADPYTFALNIATYQMLPLSVVNLMAIVLPWVELVAGALLILGLLTRVQALLINAMLVMFVAAISWALVKGLDLGTCGCFASEDAAEELSAATLWRDLGWLAIGVFVFLVPGRSLSLDRVWHSWKDRNKGVDQ